MKSRTELILLFLAVILMNANTTAQEHSLLAERRGEYLHVAAPQAHFFAGKAREKLQNGSTIAYVMTLAVVPQHTKRSALSVREKFLVSYDLWEERYSIIQSSAGGRSASKLTEAAAEAWFLDRMTIPVRYVPDREPFMLRLDCAIEENEATDNVRENHSPLTLAGLIDVFSRKSKDEPLQWQLSGGPFRLDELKR